VACQLHRLPPLREATLVKLLAALALPLLLAQCEPACDDPPPAVDVVRGDCSSYAPLFAKYGLPVQTFLRIAHRESGCDHERFTSDRDDLGGYLLGLNFRTANLRAGWLRWCGATVANVRYDADLQVACAAEAYARMGLRPWRT
jgi:hypothetical protein